MNHSDWCYFLLFGGIFGFLLFLVEVIYIRFKFPAELTRKFLHFLIGIICACFCYLFQGHLVVLLLALIFYIILGLAKRFNFMRCIHNVERKSYGGVIFPVSIWLIYFLNKLIHSPYLYFQISILILSISDPLATLGGIIIPVNRNKGWDLNSYVMLNRKTKTGSLIFLLSSSVIVF